MNQNIEIDTEGIEEYVYNNLIKRGFAPTGKEVVQIADIVFDYMLHIGIITEID